MHPWEVFFLGCMSYQLLLNCAELNAAAHSLCQGDLFRYLDFYLNMLDNFVMFIFICILFKVVLHWISISFLVPICIIVIQVVSLTNPKRLNIMIYTVTGTIWSYSLDNSLLMKLICLGASFIWILRLVVACMPEFLNLTSLAWKVPRMYFVLYAC